MRLIKRIKAMFGIGNQEQTTLKVEPEIEVGNIVAFRRDGSSEASYGTVVAVKGYMAVIDTGTSIFRQTFILPFDELIVIPSKEQEQSND